MASLAKSCSFTELFLSRLCSDATSKESIDVLIKHHSMKKVFKKWMKNLNSPELNSEELKQASTSSRSLTHPKQEITSDEFLPSKQMKLHFAVLSENISDVKKHLKYVNNVDSLQRTPLHLAVIQGNINILKILLEYGTNTDLTDNEGFTPFLRAVEIGNLEMVKIFLFENIKRDQIDLQGNTALHLAVLYGFYNITLLLLKNHFPVNISNKVGEYPLHIATQNESVQIVKLLLEHGANVDVEDLEKKTPLLIAVEIGSVSLAEIFLSNKANPEHVNVNGRSIKEYVSVQKNINMKALFSRLNLINPENEIITNDEDSQNSEQSCALPPALKPPLSWDILQMGLNSDDKDVARKKLTKNMPIRSNYERNAKSLSFDVAYDFSKNISTHNRSYSLTSYEIFNPNTFKMKAENDDNISSHEKLKNQIEDCQKALQELSLEVISPKMEKPSNSELEFKSDYLFGDLNPQLFSDPSSENYKLDNCDENNFFSKNVTQSTLNLKNVTIKIQNDNSYKDRCETSKNEHFNNTDSSDEDPPFWKKTSDGGYFTADWKRDGTSKTFKSSSDSEDSDSEKDEDLNEPPNAVVLNRLKHVSQENEDLETETAVLREATEKLKYDLANYRQLSSIKDASLNEINAQLTQMDTKYSKAIEKINIFQLCVNNLEQEMVHLKQICNKTYKMNQQLVNQIKQIQDENKQVRSEKDKITDQNNSDVQKLQTDVLYWKAKYEEINQNKEEKNFAAFEMQSLFKLNFELNKMSEKIKDCLCKSDLAKLKDQQQIIIGQKVQQILNESNVTLQNSLAEMKEEVKQKVIEIDRNSSSKTETELQIMDLENTKQRLLLEVSKLSSALKEKEIEERYLKDRLEKFSKEKQEVKDEKRKFLIKKSYEDKSSSSRKGMYLSAVRNYLNKSKPNSPTDSNLEHLSSGLKLELDPEIAKEIK